MITPRSWTIAGLVFLLTTALTILDVVIDFKTHGPEDSQIHDCSTTFEDRTSSDVEMFFAVMTMTKITLVVAQLFGAIDCFATADARLKGSNSAEVFCKGLSLIFYLIVSGVIVILYGSIAASTDCFSCCLAHRRVKLYAMWTLPSLLIIFLIALALFLALVYGIYVVLKTFFQLLVASFTYEPISTSKDVEIG